MHKSIIICLTMAPVFAAFSQSDDGQDTLAELTSRQFALLKEERDLLRQIAIFEEQSKGQLEQLALLKERLDLLNSMPATPRKEPEAIPGAEGGGDAQIAQLQDEMMSECVDRMVVLEAKDGRISTAFLAPQDGKARIFASAPWVADVGNFKVTDLNGIAVPFARELSCPVGAALLGLHPENPNMQHFELVPENGLPAVGERILVVLVDGKTRGLSAVGGAIRGIGPDTLELDAELTQEMGGAPVLALDTGKVIGIVAHQIAGVTHDWAVGTRHEGSRNFAIRLDRIMEWESSDLGRFAKEAAYIEGINRMTNIAWIAHTLIECELSSNKRPADTRASYHQEEDETDEDYRDRMRNRTTDGLENHNRRYEAWKKERERIITLKSVAVQAARKHPTNPHIIRTNTWIGEFRKIGSLKPGSPLQTSLGYNYGSLLIDLKKKDPDLSAHLTWYHKQQYRMAIESRGEGILTVTEGARRAGR